MWRASPDLDVSRDGTPDDVQLGCWAPTRSNRETKGHFDGALASTAQELTLGHRNLANAIELATQRL